MIGTQPFGDHGNLDDPQLDEFWATAAELGAIARIKNMQPKEQPLGLRDGVDKQDHDRTLRDITAAHLECPRCGHEQLDASHCARCGVDLVAAFKQKRKEDIMIEKKIRELRIRREQQEQQGGVAQAQALRAVPEERAAPPQKGEKKGGVLHWLKRT